MRWREGGRARVVQKKKESVGNTGKASIIQIILEFASRTSIDFIFLNVSWHLRSHTKEGLQCARHHDENLDAVFKDAACVPLALGQGCKHGQVYNAAKTRRGIEDI